MIEGFTSVDIEEYQTLEGCLRVELRESQIQEEPGLKFTGSNKKMTLR